MKSGFGPSRYLDLDELKIETKMSSLKMFAIIAAVPTPNVETARFTDDSYRYNGMPHTEL
jgi:hypothetical protein